MEEIAFVLEDDGTGWPPASVEWIYLLKLAVGYQVKTVPLFLKGISVDDIVDLERNDEGQVIAWRHIQKSGRSSIWIMVHGDNDISDVLSYLRSLGCNTETLTSYRYYAVDVPEDVAIEKVDKALETIDEGVASVVFPSLRHEG